MAKTVSIASDRERLETILTKALQSGHINFLLGSGASLPAIPTAGNIENELDQLQESDPANFSLRRNAFLSTIQSSTNDLIEGAQNENNATTFSGYDRFLGLLARILHERKTDLLPKQVTVFTTNYDLFIERASEAMPSLRLNDGFTRNPAVCTSYSFQPEHYFDVTFKTGALFRHKSPIPTVNLIKLHGSLSWRVSAEGLCYHAESRPIPDENSASFEQDVATFADSFSLVLPTRDKFHQTLLTQVYYDLLRIFANALEIENVTLVCFGFSFDDRHILDIVSRALKNPTLLVLVVSYDDGSVAHYREKFDRHENVIVIHPTAPETIDFARLNDLLESIIPKT